LPGPGDGNDAFAAAVAGPYGGMTSAAAPEASAERILTRV